MSWRMIICVLACTLLVGVHAKSSYQLLWDAVHGRVSSRGAEATTLKDAAARTGRYFGSCLAQSELTNTELINALLKDWNSVTPENEMKWDATEPQNNTWNWGAADAIYNFAQTNKMILRGHTLVWHSQLPNWVRTLTSQEAMLQAMYNHMEVLMAHYKGKIYAWDVVNEAFADDGSENLRQDSPWVHVFGNSTKFIELAFTHARLQDPDAKLCYNDYSTDGINPKSTGVYKMVKDFKARGVPIDCVGFQGHLNGYPSATFQENLQRFADLGVEVYLTELDIQETTAGGAEPQAAAYSAVVGACLNVTACKGITTWGVDDANSWKSNTTPLLLDANFKPKPAYNATLDVLNKPDPNVKAAAADAKEEEKDDESETDTCVAQAQDLGSRLGHHLKFRLHALNGHSVARVAVMGRNGRALPMSARHGVYELTGSAMRAVRVLPLTLRVTAADGTESTILVNTLKAGVMSSC